MAGIGTKRLILGKGQALRNCRVTVREGRPGQLTAPAGNAQLLLGHNQAGCDDRARRGADPAAAMLALRGEAGARDREVGEPDVLHLLFFNVRIDPVGSRS
jgi:hypothetical protein